ncbi:MAG: hypothetical protein ACOCVY_02200 [Patescibacteria group bacterium]
MDVSTGEYLDFSAFYLLPIVLAAWFIGPNHSLFIAIISLLVWINAEISVGIKYQIVDDLTAGIIFIANAILVTINYLIIVFLITLLKKKVQLSAEQKLIRQKTQTIIDLSQNICGLFGEHVTRHNSEIMNWINAREESGQQVSDKVKRASSAIGKEAQAFSKVSFNIQNYSQDMDVDSFLKELKRQLESIEKFDTKTSKKLSAPEKNHDFKE